MPSLVKAKCCYATEKNQKAYDIGFGPRLHQLGTLGITSEDDRCGYRSQAAYSWKVQNGMENTVLNCHLEIAAAFCTFQRCVCCKQGHG